MTTEQRIWSNILEMEFISITHLMFEVNRTGRFSVAVFFFNNNLGANINVTYYPGEFRSKEILKMNIETSAHNFLSEEAFIAAKHKVETVKRKLLECIHGAVSEVLENENTTSDLTM